MRNDMQLDWFRSRGGVVLSERFDDDGQDFCLAMILGVFKVLVKGGFFVSVKRKKTSVNPGFRTILNTMLISFGDKLGVPKSHGVVYVVPGFLS